MRDINQTELNGDGDGVDAPAGFQLPDRIRQMPLDGALSDAEARGDLLRRAPRCEEFEHGELALGQVRDLTVGTAVHLVSIDYLS